MKKLAIIITFVFTFILVGCGSSKSTVEISENNVNNKLFEVGQEAIINDNGKEMYSLKIDSIKKVDNFEYKEDFKDAKEIIEVTYTYKNINKEDRDLAIHGAELQVIDKNGTVAQSSSMFPKGKPKEIGVGVNCKVNAYYGLSTESNKVKIIFKSKQYNQKIEFEGEVQ